MSAFTRLRALAGLFYMAQALGRVKTRMAMIGWGFTRPAGLSLSLVAWVEDCGGDGVIYIVYKNSKNCPVFICRAILNSRSGSGLCGALNSITFKEARPLKVYR